MLVFWTIGYDGLMGYGVKRGLSPFSQCTGKNNRTNTIRRNTLRYSALRGLLP